MPWVSLFPPWVKKLLNIFFIFNKWHIYSLLWPEKNTKGHWFIRRSTLYHPGRIYDWQMSRNICYKIIIITESMRQSENQAKIESSAQPASRVSGPWSGSQMCQTVNTSWSSASSFTSPGRWHWPESCQAATCHTCRGPGKGCAGAVLHREWNFTGANSFWNKMHLQTSFFPLRPI